MSNHLAVIAMSTVFAALAVVPARAAEATFQRDLTVSGRVDLTVTTGAGSVHLTAGPAGHVHIFGRVKSNWSESGGNVQEIAAHPPIEQTGNIIRIGVHQAILRNMGIDYEIEAPANTFLKADAGSGSVIDDGVGADAKLSTGSGSIRATGLQGGFALSTGSGNIYGEQVGAGDVSAETGSGSIELRSLRGDLRAHSGSGSIKVGGTPAAPWRIETGAGSVEIWTGNAGFTLDASSGSGGIHSDREIATQGSLGRHHVMGKIAGGGPTVRIETGSGAIRIH
jgi:hypothetical protein